jgi:hypothetical protein
LCTNSQTKEKFADSSTHIFRSSYITLHTSKDTNIKERLKQRIKLTPNFTAIVTAHGKTKAYLHRFNIIDSPECPCEAGHQTVDHLIYECQLLQTERENFISSIAKRDIRQLGKSELVNKYVKQFIQFTNVIDFEKL